VVDQLHQAKNLFTILTVKSELLADLQNFFCGWQETRMSLSRAEATRGQIVEALSNFSAEPQEAEARVAVPIVSVQCWVARTVLGWSATHLARAAGLSWNSVARFERDGAVSARTVETIRRTLEKAGVIFIDANDGGPGARLRKGS
jgi:hypothetical protein